MPLVWTEDFKVGIGFMDADHHEAVEMINAMASAAPAERLDLFRSFVAHNEAHFAREEELMRQVDFFAYAPHKAEHDRVLDFLRGLLGDLEAGRPVDDEVFTIELGDWLIGHRNSMDMVTAQYARQQGKV